MMAAYDDINTLNSLTLWHLGDSLYCACVCVSWWQAGECCLKAISWYHPASDAQCEADWTFFASDKYNEKAHLNEMDRSQWN